MGDIVRKHKLWTAQLPRVEPFYGNLSSLNTVVIYRSFFQCVLWFIMCLFLFSVFIIHELLNETLYMPLNIDARAIYSFKKFYLLSVYNCANRINCGMRVIVRCPATLMSFCIRSGYIERTFLVLHFISILCLRC